MIIFDKSSKEIYKLSYECPQIFGVVAGNEFPTCKIWWYHCHVLQLNRLGNQYIVTLSPIQPNHTRNIKLAINFKVLQIYQEYFTMYIYCTVYNIYIIVGYTIYVEMVGIKQCPHNKKWYIQYSRFLQAMACSYNFRW